MLAASGKDATKVTCYRATHRSLYCAVCAKYRSSSKLPYFQVICDIPYFIALKGFGFEYYSLKQFSQQSFQFATLIPSPLSFPSPSSDSQIEAQTSASLTFHTGCFPSTSNSSSMGLSNSVLVERCPPIDLSITIDKTIVTPAQKAKKPFLL